MSIEFFQTVMGRGFYDGSVPRIARSLERIADALEKIGEIQKHDAQKTDDKLVRSIAEENGD